MSTIRAKAKTKKATISARVWREKEQKWIDLGEIARPRESILERIIRKLRGD